jgi:hypothetical protein
MTGTNCDLFTHNQSRSYLNHLVIYVLFFHMLFIAAFLWVELHCVTICHYYTCDTCHVMCHRIVF